MVLICIVRLGVHPLKPNPLLGLISSFPHHIVKHVSGKAEDPCRPHVAVVVSFKRNTFPKQSVLNQERRVIRKSYISTSVRSSSYMSTATIVEVLGFLPVDQFVAIVTVVAMILHFASLIVSNKGIVVVEVVHYRSRQTCIITLTIKSSTK